MRRVFEDLMTETSAFRERNPGIAHLIATARSPRQLLKITKRYETVLNPDGGLAAMERAVNLQFGLWALEARYGSST